MSAALLFLMLRGAHLPAPMLRSVSHCSLASLPTKKEALLTCRSLSPSCCQQLSVHSWLGRLGVASAWGGVIGEALSALLGCGAGGGHASCCGPTSRTSPTGKKSKAPQCHFDEWFRITKLSSSEACLLESGREMEERTGLCTNRNS